MAKRMKWRSDWIWDSQRGLAREGACQARPCPLSVCSVRQFINWAFCPDVNRFAESRYPLIVFRLKTIHVDSHTFSVTVCFRSPILLQRRLALKFNR